MLLHTLVSCQLQQAASHSWRAVEQILDLSNAAYSSTDLLLRATFNQDSVWEDLSVTQQAYRQQVSSNLQSYGWNMVGMMHHSASASVLMPPCQAPSESVKQLVRRLLSCLWALPSPLRQLRS